MTISLGAHTFRWLSRVLVRGFAGVIAVHEGLWLGLLRERSLQKITDAAYAAPSDRYGTNEYNAQGLFDWEREAIERYFPPKGSVLIGAAGGGREAFALARQGFNVVAFDSSDRLVRLFRERLPSDLAAKAKIYVAPANDVPPGLSAVCDCAIVGWGAFTHITSSGARIHFLRAFSEKVNLTGPILISFHVSPPASKADRLREFLASKVAYLTGNRRVERGDRFRLDLHPTFLHLFTRIEIEELLARAGLTLMHYVEGAPQAYCVAIRSRREGE